MCMDLRHNLLRHWFAITGVLVLASGCASTDKMVDAQYDKNNENTLPPLAVFYDSPSEELSKACKSFNDESAFQYCHVNVVEPQYYYQSLADSKMFQEVMFADKEAEYKVAFSTVNLHSEKAAELSNIALSSASLFLIPMTSEQEVRAEVSVYWRNVKIKQYDYQLPYVSKTSLFTQLDEADKRFSQNLASHFIADAQKDNLFSSEYLAQVLQSSDYTASLNVPVTIADFQRVEQYTFRDPFFGTMITYMNPDYLNDKIDLFVYPIRKIDFADHQTALAEESANIRKEIELVIREQAWTDLTFTDVKTMQQSVEGAQIDGLYFSGSYKNELQEEVFTSVFLFAYKDKFVKFRATFPEQFLSDHVAQALTQISVPDESLFMARLRQQSREKQIN